MLTIRLTRVGKKKDASFRVVVVDSKRKVQAGNYLEMVGSYDPRVDTSTLNAERIKHWISVGAQPSDTVHNLLVSNKIIDAKKRNVLPKKTVAKAEEPAPAADAAAVVPAAVDTDVKEEVAAEAPAEAVEVAAEAAADTSADAGGSADGGAAGGGDGGSV